MASLALAPELDVAIRAYADGDTTLEDLRAAALAHLREDQIDVFLRGIPSEAAAGLVRWLRAADQEARLISVGNFAAEPSPDRTVREAMIRHVGDAWTWFSRLDVAAAAANVRDDSFGDWYRDPWGWAELSYLSGEGRIHLLTRALRDPAGAALAIDVPKSATQTRPAVVLDLVDRLLYQACVDSIAPEVDRGLKPWVFGWRAPDGARYASNQVQWRCYFERLRAGARRHGYGWHTDIADFFASVAPVALHRVLERVAPARTLATIMTQVGNASRSAGRAGIPQRATASSVLANLLLVPIDEVADRAGAMPARWLDDIWIFASAGTAADQISGDVSAKIVELGFRPNLDKTVSYEGAALDQAIDRFDFAYIDSQLEHTAQSPVLRAALELLLANPELAARHEISFVTSRIKRYHRSDLAQQLAEQRARFVHAADLVAPVLLKTGVWRDLIAWCDELLSSRALPWVKTSFLRMYPRSERWPRELVDAFTTASAATGTDTLVRITALSRLARFAPAVARNLFEAHRNAKLDPMLRRAFAAVAVSVGAPGSKIRRFLLEDDRTVPFAEFLRSVGYQREALRVVA